jgi:hypothetical protein
MVNRMLTRCGAMPTNQESVVDGLLIRQTSGENLTESPVRFFH